MFFIIVPFVTLLLLSHVIAEDDYCGVKVLQRVLGGRDAGDKEFPWMVSIQFFDGRSWQHNCGGAIVSNRIVLTAAHCKRRVLIYPSHRVVAGCQLISNADSNPVCQIFSFTADDFIAHESFRRDRASGQYDVAVIKLDQAFEYHGNVRPICLPGQDVADVVTGQKLIAAGWGYMEDTQKPVPWRKDLVRMSDMLQTVELEVFDPEICQDAYHYVFSDINQICMGSVEEFKDTCGGDSGGPIMIKHKDRYYVVGIVSRGLLCGRGIENPALYTRVKSFLEWIITAAQSRSVDYY